jgi:hypothetical protein
VTTKWQLHTKSHITSQDPRDFKKLNKMSLKSGSVNARDQYKYRASHDARIPFGLVEDKPVMLPGDEFCYGKRNRPQTPVTGIIANHYGETAGQELQQRYAHKKEAVSSLNFKVRLVKEHYCWCDRAHDPLPDGDGRGHQEQVH